jgi:predicted ester cyclase
MEEHERREVFMPEREAVNARDVLTRNITAINSRDIEGYLANQQPDVELVLPGGVTLHGRVELRRYVEALWAAFPDGKLAFGEQVYAEDAAAVELVFTGTHTGPLATADGQIPQTGKEITLHSAAILRIKDGLIATEHGYGDPLELMAQLGVTPPLGSPASDEAPEA